MRIGIISQLYAPEPAFIATHLAEELTRRGHEVRVLTGFPNYPQGRVYPAYRQRWHDVSATGGLTVRRVPLYPSHDSSPVRRIASYLSFAATSSLAAIRYLATVDVLYVYHPPVTAFTPAALLKLLHRVPAVLHVQDVWPESVTASSMAPSGRPGKLLHQALGGAMRRVYRSAASVAVIAPSMRELVIERGANAERVRVVLNWTDETLFRPVAVTDEARRAIGHRGRCTVMYAGNIGAFQNIGGAIRAASQASSEMDLVLVGSGTEEGSARALATSLGADNVRFLGRREPSEMAALYGAADYQLISLLDLPIFRGTIPSKLQAAMSCGSPVVVSAAGDCAELVERSGAGLAYPPENWPALAQGFLRAASLSHADRADMGRRARENYQAHMSLQAGVDQLEDMLVSAAQRGPIR